LRAALNLVKKTSGIAVFCGLALVGVVVSPRTNLFSQKRIFTMVVCLRGSFMANSRP